MDRDRPTTPHHRGPCWSVAKAPRPERPFYPHSPPSRRGSRILGPDSQLPSGAERAGTELRCGTFRPSSGRLWLGVLGGYDRCQRVTRSSWSRVAEEPGSTALRRGRVGLPQHGEARGSADAGVGRPGSVAASGDLRAHRSPCRSHAGSSRGRPSTRMCPRCPRSRGASVAAHTEVADRAGGDSSGTPDRAARSHISASRKRPDRYVSRARSRINSYIRPVRAGQLDSYRAEVGHQRQSSVGRRAAP